MTETGQVLARNTIEVHRQITQNGPLQ